MAATCSSPPWHRIDDSPNGDSRGSRSSSKLGPTDPTPERPSSRNTGSPEESCAICLGQPENKSFTDSCFHQFCFACLAEWAKVKAECPLCKQRFKSIIHSVRSLEDYDQYFVDDQQYLPVLSAQRVYEPRVGFSITMTAEQRRRQQLEEAALRQAHERYQNRYLPRGATTSHERRELYILDLWATPSMSQYREASPEFYRENPACTHRLVPWLNRELNALMLEEGRSRRANALDHVMSLILSFDIRHPQFALNMLSFLERYTEHFVHEFYLFATSVYGMVDYDARTVYDLREVACARTDPVGWFRQYLRESEEVAAFEQQITATPERQDSPQPGPSGIAVTREEVVAASVDSDSDSSDCVVVRVVKPARERTPVVIELLSSDEDDCPPRDNSQAGPCNEGAGPSSRSCRKKRRKPLAYRGSSDSSSSDSSLSGARDRHSQRRHSRTHEHSVLSHDSRQAPVSHGSSSRSGQEWQRYADFPDAALYSPVSSSSTSSDEDSKPPSVRPRKLASVVGAVNIARKSREVSRHEHHHSHHHRHERRSRKKSARKHKHKRRSSSHDF
ncbi:hypothetical protein HPB50_011544 [Hyalomma asiaticum]|uniref:Uncharacterized protein n=1 Tax=Hyalomma asiaticum TaxID=266040 RepID=A0ACB7T286_HYAAI|nr:hypothetical protein HPB50_011544 [Hyalomma asiaticum]